jgi:diguanylate cyclase (GGDEF)-like protein/PAS domain S-box-containing protein
MHPFRAFLRRSSEWVAHPVKAQTGVFAFVALMCMAIVGLDAFHLYDQRSQAIAEGRQETANLARSLAQHADDTILAVDAVALGLVDRIERDGTSPAVRERLREAFLARMALLPQLNSITVTDADGNLLVTSQPMTQKVNIADRDYFQFHKANSDPGAHIDAPVKGRVTGAWVIPLIRRINHADGSFAGVLVATLDTAYFQKFYDRFEIGRSGAILLANADGTLLVRRPFAEGNIGKSLHDSHIFRELLPQGPTGNAEITSSTDGVVRLNSWKRTEVYPLVVAVALAKEDILSPWRANAWRNAIVIGMLVVGILVLGLRLSHQIGLRVAAQRAAEAATAQYRLLADNSGDMIFRLDPNFIRRYVSPACRELLGYEPEELIGTAPVTMIHPDDAGRIAEIHREMFAGRERAEATNRIRHRDGRWVWVEASFRLIRDPQSGEPREIVGTLHNITLRVEAQTALRESEARYRLLADNTTDVIMLIGPDGKRLYVSPACRDLFGYEPEELIDHPVGEIVHPDDRVAWAGARSRQLGENEVMQVTYRAIRKDGPHVWVEASRRRLPEELGYVVSIRDISERKQMQDQLAAANRRLTLLATKDGLTGLANRRHFDERLDAEFRRAMRDGTTLSLIMIDIDHFKGFNDRYGHPAGDDCLRRVGLAIKHALRRPDDLAARYGGEEFVVLLPNTAEIGAAALAEHMLTAVQDLRIAYDTGREKIVTISLGVAAFAPERRLHRPGDLVEAADHMLYAAKAGGRNMVCSPPLPEQVNLGILRA